MGPIGLRSAPPFPPIERGRTPKPSPTGAVQRSADSDPPPALFVCGNARGGTTLLVRLLDGHPDLLVLPTETQIYPALATRAASRWLLRLAEIGGWREAMGLLARPGVARIGFGGRRELASRLRLWAREYPEADRLDDAAIEGAAMLAAGPQEYWLAFLDVFSRFTGETLSGKRYWVEKTPRAERFAAVSDAWCGGRCTFLHVLRDPRDFIASWLMREERMRGVAVREEAIVRLCVIWSQSVAWCAHNLRTLGGRYHAIRYEDLVRDPAKTMGDVCEQIGIAMDVRLLTPTRLGEPVAHNSSDRSTPGAPGEIVRASVGRFAESLSAPEVDRIERLLAGQMEACGYALRGASSDAWTRRGAGAGSGRELTWRARVLARLTARSQDAWRGRTLSLLG